MRGAGTQREMPRLQSSKKNEFALALLPHDRETASCAGVAGAQKNFRKDAAFGRGAERRESWL
jgi:hypothetical protein